MPLLNEQPVDRRLTPKERAKAYQALADVDAELADRVIGELEADKIAVALHQLRTELTDATRSMQGELAREMRLSRWTTTVLVIIVLGIAGGVLGLTTSVGFGSSDISVRPGVIEVDLKPEREPESTLEPEDAAVALPTDEHPPSAPTKQEPTP